MRLRTRTPTHTYKHRYIVAHNHAFTLAEILVAILIFLIISSAMFGILMSATNLFRQGESAKSSNDEAQIVCNLLEQDIARALPSAAGGVFYARLDNNSSGNCCVGWVIRNPHQDSVHPTPYVFVLWGIDAINDAYLQRVIIGIPNGGLRNLALSSLAGFDPDNPAASLSSTSGGVHISKSCLLFSVWLTGTSHKIAGKYVICNKPSANMSSDGHNTVINFWSAVTDGIINLNNEPSTEPSDPTHYYSNSKRNSDGSDNTHNITVHINGVDHYNTYPSAIRFSIVLSGDEKFTKEGRLASELLATTTDYIASIAGVENLKATPGAIIRVGDSSTNYEWIGYHDIDGQGLHINDQWEHGPCTLDNSNNPIGRGIFRSLVADHAPGEKVNFGKLLTLTRTFPQ